MHVMIHTCNKRQWFVYQYLIPELKRQGLKKEQIWVWHDYKRIGNLHSFLASLSQISKNYPPTTAFWHIQDDVWPCSDFVTRARQEQEYDGIICGFCCQRFNKTEYEDIGIQPVKKIWYSFPCIRIPVYLSTEFVSWLYTQGVKNQKYWFWYKQGKADDSLFRWFLLEKHYRQRLKNYTPALVEHVDYLVGGTTVNQQRGYGPRTAYYWQQPERIESLRQLLQEREKLNTENLGGQKNGV